MTAHRFPGRGAFPNASAFLAAVSWVLVGASAPGADSEGIPWREDYSRSIEEARASGQLLWIQFTGPWCPNCTRMDQDSFHARAVLKRARESFVALKLRSDEHEDLALGFELSGLPATVIVAPSREVVAVHQGYLGPDELDDFLRQASKRQQDKREAARRLVTRGESESEKRTESVSPERATESATTKARQSVKHEDKVALSGYCPVSLMASKKLVPGQVAYTLNHEGRLYRFANLLTFNLFRRDPERYVPLNDGNCPVSQVDHNKPVSGDPKFGVLYQGRLFLCASQADRARFIQNPTRYAAVDVAEQGFCPHCLTQEGVLVRGDPRFGINREGRKYWFPDASHRDAFLASSGDAPTRR